ncbi:hypothetical protein [Ensifer sp.]|nr:hypothetical protein [Ensifer sp.]
MRATEKPIQASDVAAGLDFLPELSDPWGIMMSIISSYCCFRVCPIAGP